ncbi:MAG: DegV family protein [Clostridia bacterium]|nr:DegV family protein [Clostridia bacterium]
MYKVLTDTSANLDQQWLIDHDVPVIPFHYYVNGKDNTCTNTRGFDGKAFYNAMRAGEKVTTSQITPQAFIDGFKPWLDQGQDILFVSMSSGISGSFSQSQSAARELEEAYPQRKIRLVDTYSASLGEGLLVVKAVECRDKGTPIEEAFELLQELRHSMCQVFTVDDLKYLRNTGRLSNMAALVGMVLNIKPLLKGDTEGKIVSFAKLRGRKKAVIGLVEQYDKFVRNAGSQMIGIAHADCQEDVDYLISLLKRNNPPKDIMTVMYEPVTGSHVGPGTLALFFFGDAKFRGASDSLLASITQRVDEGREALRSTITQKVDEGKEAIRSTIDQIKGGRGDK